MAPGRRPRHAASAAGAAPAGEEPSPPHQQQQQRQGGLVQHEQQQQQQQQERQGGLRQHRRTDPNTAFVKHLADSVDEATVRELFASCGPITSMELGRDRATGRTKV